MITFIIDASVVFHLINARLQQYALNSDNRRLYVQASLLWINALGMFPYYAGADGCTVIWVMDSKPYWRSQYYPDYKANRPSRSNEISFILEIFNDLKLPCMKVDGYEADDLAALFCVLFRRRPLRSDWEQVYLLTIDSDWQGLIGEGITWVDVNNHEPRIRDSDVVHDWFVGQYFKQPKKWQRIWPLPDKCDFHPSDIWKWKVAVGDKADNLPPDCDYHLINLYEPYAEHALWLNSDVVKQAQQLVDGMSLADYSAKEMTTVLNGLGLSMPLSYIVL